MERYDLKLTLDSTFEFNAILPSVSSLSLSKCWKLALISSISDQQSEAFQ